MTNVRWTPQGYSREAEVCSVCGAPRWVDEACLHGRLTREEADDGDNALLAGVLRKLLRDSEGYVMWDDPGRHDRSPWLTVDVREVEITPEELAVIHNAVESAR